ncbi:MAG: HAMP domain-containing sensor histidine kinase [Gemmatimonadales bacterium]
MPKRAEALERTLRAELLGDLGNVERRIGQALKFLQSLQDQARGALARFERFNAVSVVQSCVVLMRPLARKQGVGLKWETSLDVIFLQGDPNALYRLTTNVIRNAVDASAAHSDFVTVTLEQVGEALHVAVRDRGAGIPPEHLDRIFEPRFTTREFGSGDGLGLTLVRELAETMFGGTATAKSTLGAGTLVTVVLPIPPQRRPRPETSPKG